MTRAFNPLLTVASSLFNQQVERTADASSATVANTDCPVQKQTSGAHLLRFICNLPLMPMLEASASPHDLSSSINAPSKASLFSSGVS
jgi:hypothetical protein